MSDRIPKEELPYVIAKNDLPYGKISHKFEGHRYGDVDVSFFLVDSPPGGGAVLHTHPYEEIFVTLEGEATFTVGDATIEVSAGQIVGHARGRAPQVRQLGERTAEAGRHPSQRTHSARKHLRRLLSTPLVSGWAV